MNGKRTSIVLLTAAAVIGLTAAGVWVAFSKTQEQRQRQAVYDAVYRRFRERMTAVDFEPLKGRLSLEESPNTATVYLDQTPIAVYCYDAVLSKPILAPLATPSGQALTRPVGGDVPKEHPHHQGLFVAYGDVNGVDFWGNLGTEIQIRHADFLEKRADPNGVTLRVALDWKAAGGKTLVREDRTMRFLAVRGGYSIQVEIRLTAAAPLTFGDTKEGLFAIRLADWVREKDGCGRFYDAAGTQTAGDIWGTQSPWVCLVGAQQQRAVVLAVEAIRGSFNYPPYWHVRDYGLFAANPLGREVFESGRGNASARPRQAKLMPGISLSWAFRVVVCEEELEKGVDGV